MFDGLDGLVVGDVQFRIVTFFNEHVVILFKCSDNDVVCHACDWDGRDGVCAVIVSNKKILVAIERLHGQGTGAVSIKSALLFVG